ncbi:bcl-2-like protein 15 isoform X2 [Numida meleagris]|uniref:bcl-2-like protein 15 isoform X2 n=1 Tax=Numida meleagris TaxID=8996 RepID=UPI000B3DAF89|nr:bcl-2-like protein 15 isoform X2 [Numida meleagris]
MMTSEFLLTPLVVSGSVQSEEESPSYFDPVIIANRLRQIGDQCNMDFERVSSQVLREVLMGQMEKFGAAVDALSRRWSDQNPELVYERAFLSVSVKLMMYILKKGAAQVNPSHLIKAINENVQVKNYIEACGGWEKLDN